MPSLRALSNGPYSPFAPKPLIILFVLGLILSLSYLLHDDNEDGISSNSNRRHKPTATSIQAASAIACLLLEQHCTSMLHFNRASVRVRVTMGFLWSSSLAPHGAKSGRIFTFVGALRSTVCSRHRWCICRFFPSCVCQSATLTKTRVCYHFLMIAGEIAAAPLSKEVCAHTNVAANKGPLCHPRGPVCHTLGPVVLHL